MIFFENNLSLQSDVVFDSESNDCNFSSLAPPGGEKKNIFNFFLQNDVTSRRFSQISNSISRTPRGHPTLHRKYKLK